MVDSFRWLRLVLQSVAMNWTMLGVSKFLRHDSLSLINARKVAALTA